MKLVLSIATALLVVGSVAAPAATADSKAATHTVKFTTHYTDPGTRVTGLGSCRPGPTLCELRYGGTATFTGGLESFDDYYGYFHADPAKPMVLEGEGWDRQTGTLTGCGEGSFVMHQTEAHPTAVDPATGTFHFTLKWEIQPGSGTGDFQGARGSGIGTGDYKPDLSNTGVYTGVLTCRTRQ
ncbi:MAG: hypothetical protein QOJ79_1506 [Actinomycetota bacterium]|jgi:hypothetical protein|nr:hypothetical protein [Actinomycetota bacterium]